MTDDDVYELNTHGLLSLSLLSIEDEHGRTESDRPTADGSWIIDDQVGYVD